MNSSYKNKDIDYGELLEAITLSQRPKSIIEIGILDGYSLQHFVNSTNSDKTQICAYDIFDEFNGNHAKEAELKERFKKNTNVTINYGDFYELYKTIDDSIDIIHIDIANTGDIYEFAIQHYLPKLSPSGIMLLEGGSKQRDEIEWMNKYNKSKIVPVLQKYSERDYTIKTFGAHPSLTMISLSR
jgi:predicted O-methyltransferase YrrM